MAAQGNKSVRVASAGWTGSEHRLYVFQSEQLNDHCVPMFMCVCVCVCVCARVCCQSYMDVLFSSCKTH